MGLNGNNTFLKERKKMYIQAVFYLQWIKN